MNHDQSLALADLHIKKAAALCELGNYEAQLHPAFHLASGAFLVEVAEIGSFLPHY